jgi:hypothetical protein
VCGLTGGPRTRREGRGRALSDFELGKTNFCRFQGKCHVLLLEGGEIPGFNSIFRTRRCGSASRWTVCVVFDVGPRVGGTGRALIRRSEVEKWRNSWRGTGESSWDFFPVGAVPLRRFFRNLFRRKETKCYFHARRAASLREPCVMTFSFSLFVWLMKVEARTGVWR